MPSSRPRKPRARPGAGANRARGEHALTLAGVTYRLRPSFAANQAVEADTDRSLIELFRGANAMTLPLEELGIVAAAYIRAGAEEGDTLTRAVSAEKIAELIYEEGLAGVFATLALLLADAVSGGRTASGEAKAVTGATA